MNNIFKGSGVALVTPFHADNSIDFDALRKLVRLQIDGGIDFLVVQGTTGESPTLTSNEKLEVLKTVIEDKCQHKFCTTPKSIHLCQGNSQ